MPISDSSWHLDKRVPISIIVALLAQSAAIVWWGSQLQIRVELIEADIRATATVEGRIIRNETRIEQIDRSLGRIEEKIDQVIDRLSNSKD